MAEEAGKRAEVNSRLKTIEFKGRPYVEVSQRILGFWELYPEGAIKTELLGDTGNRCTFKAEIYDGDKLLATGHAFEEKTGFINKTSYLENCETSAIGRALGILGIGSTDSIASFDEVTQANEASQYQEKQPPQQGPFVAKCKACGAQYQFTDANQLATSQCNCGNRTFEVC